MKKTEVQVGMRVFRERTVINKKTADNPWHYGVVTSEAFEVQNSYRGLWKVNVKFDNGKEAPVPLNMLKKCNED